MRRLMTYFKLAAKSRFKSLQFIYKFFWIFALVFAQNLRAEIFENSECRSLFISDQSLVVSSEDKTNLVKSAQSKLNEAQQAVQAALHSHGDQTSVLLSLWRNMTQESREKAVSLLTINSDALAKATQLLKENSVDSIKKTIAEIETLRQEPESRMRLFGQNKDDKIKLLLNSLKELPKKVSLENAKKESHLKTLLGLKRELKLALTALHQDLDFLESLCLWISSIQGIDAVDSIELHVFLNGVRGQANMISAQIRALSDQATPLETSVKSFSELVIESDHFLNVDWPQQKNLFLATNPLKLLSDNRVGKTDLKSIDDLHERPDLSTQAFRSFQSGDKIRIVYAHDLIGNYGGYRVISHVSEGFFEQRGNSRESFVHIEQPLKMSWGWIGQQIQWGWIGRQMQPTNNERIIPLNLNVQSVIATKLKWPESLPLPKTHRIEPTAKAWFMLANPEATFGAFQIDDIVELQGPGTHNSNVILTADSRELPEDYLRLYKILGFNSNEKTKTIFLEEFYYNPQLKDRQSRNLIVMHAETFLSTAKMLQKREEN